MKSLEVNHPQLGLFFNSTINQLPFEQGFENRLKKAVKVFEYFLSNKKGEIGKLYTQKVPFSLSVTLCDDEKMQELNRDYRGKDKTTDVLSFPLFEDLRSGGEFLFGLAELGDIFISVSVMKKQAEEFNVTIEQEFLHLLTHGFLHLCGFDHEISSEEEKLMESLEKKLIEKIYNKLFKG